MAPFEVKLILGYLIELIVDSICMCFRLRSKMSDVPKLVVFRNLAPDVV